MQQLTAIIVDDEEHNRQNLSALLSKHCPEVVVLAEAASVPEAYQQIKATSPEVVFLDIEMPNANGFALLELFDELPFKVVFVTAYDAYALKAIKFSASDYILKPIDHEDLRKAIDDLLTQSTHTDINRQSLNSFLNQEEKKIALTLSDEIRLIALSQVIRIQADNNYAKFYLNGGEEILVSKHLGFYYDIIKDFGFMRVHQSHLINQKYVDRYVKKDGGYLMLTNGDQVPISRTQKENLLKWFSSL